MPKDRKRLTYGQQIQVIDFYKQNKHKMTMDEVLFHFRAKGFETLCASTVRRYARDEAAIRQHVASNTRNADSSRRSPAAHPDVESALWDWIIDLESRNVRVTGILIREKARRIAADLGIPLDQSISFSDGWLTRFKERWGIKRYIFHGEAASAPIENIDGQRTLLRGILARFAPADRFNVDETGLNFRFSPTSGLASHALPGLKVDKTRLTYTLCTNSVGEKLPPLVIGRAKQPHCFKRGPPSEYGFYYRFNSKAWMRTDIWQEYLSELNAYMHSQNRRILLLCDNCSSHSHDSKAYSNIEVVFLPPNLTSWIQPMDAGIIRTFKANYRRLLTQHALDLDGQGVANPYHVNQLDAMRLADHAWRAVSPTTIVNCWRHTGICPEDRSLEERLAAASI